MSSRALLAALTVIATSGAVAFTACGGATASPPSDAGSFGDGSAGGSRDGSPSGDASGDGNGTLSEGGAPTGCTLQGCGDGCCAGTYCWANGYVCLPNGTCPAAGVDNPAAGLCSCDGYPAGPCPSGEVCPYPQHGQATYCAPADAATPDPFFGSNGAPCTADGECEGGVCLGGPFLGGYCVQPIADCSGASCVCEANAFVDVDGGSLAANSVCTAGCRGDFDCRPEYSCCFTHAGSVGPACLPASLCGD